MPCLQVPRYTSGGLLKPQAISARAHAKTECNPVQEEEEEEEGGDGGGGGGGSGGGQLPAGSLRPRQVVWAKVEGHEWWPARVVRRRAVPREVGPPPGGPHEVRPLPPVYAPLPAPPPVLRV